MKRIIILLLGLIILFSACSKNNSSSNNNQAKKHKKSPEEPFDPKKPMSWGKDQVIYVFADQPIWKENESNLRLSLERPFYTVQDEKLFEIRLGEVAKLDQYFKYKNLLFYCDLSSNDPVSVYVKQMMNQTMKDYVAKNSVGMFAVHNMWANEQFTVFMIGKNKQSLLNYNYQSLNELFYYFKLKFVARTAYKLNKLKKINLNEFKDFPFTLAIPDIYLLYKRDPQKHFISYMWRSREDQKQNPDKYISVYYEQSETNIVDKEWLEKTRKRIAWEFYDQDEMNKEDVQFARYKFLERPTYYMSGRWQNKKYYIGGAFQAVAFYDQESKTAYLIDTSVYFPYGEKLKYLIELESISSTFQVK